MLKPTYYIGIDGGGTHCRVRLETDSGELVATGKSGPANVMRDVELAISSTLEAVNQAIHKTNLNIELSQCVVGAGLAGANISSAAKTYCSWKHPFKSLTLISDLRAACFGAHNGNDGAIIIIGTGSSATYCSQGQYTDMGGHGFPIGDSGSGAWIGLQAVQHCLRSLDGLSPRDKLTDAVLSHFHVTTALELVTVCADLIPKDYAAVVKSLLPILNQNCESLDSIFATGGQYIQAMAHKLLEENALPLVLLGGLANVYKPMMDASIQSRICEAILSPEQGALNFAKDKFVTQEARL